MKMFRSNSESNPNRISWTQIVNAIVQALIGKRPKMSQRPYLRAFCKVRKSHF